MYVCGALALLSLVVGAVFVGTGWSWPLLFWGVALGLVAGPLLHAVGAYAFFRDPRSEVDATNAQVFRSRSRVVNHGLLLICTGMGIFSAALGTSVALALMTVMLGLFTVVQLAAGAAYRRRQK
jgi:hypothetical protein